jgi:hypothetical protein
MASGGVTHLGIAPLIEFFPLWDFFHLPVPLTPPKRPSSIRSWCFSHRLDSFTRRFRRLGSD